MNKSIIMRLEEKIPLSNLGEYEFQINHYNCRKQEINTSQISRFLKAILKFNQEKRIYSSTT